VKVGFTVMVVSAVVKCIRRFARNMATMYTEQQRPSNIRSNLKINLFFYDKEFDSYD
jgi:hypothetical protein